MSSIISESWRGHNIRCRMRATLWRSPFRYICRLIFGFVRKSERRIFVYSLEWLSWIHHSVFLWLTNFYSEMTHDTTGETWQTPYRGTHPPILYIRHQSSSLMFPSSFSVSPSIVFITRFFCKKYQHFRRSLVVGSKMKIAWFFIAIVAVATASKLDPCFKKPEPGPCFGAFLRYFYNQETDVRVNYKASTNCAWLHHLTSSLSLLVSQQCEKFIWGGCLGSVPFNSLDECTKAKCTCKEKPDPGPCEAAIPSYFFNQTTNVCKSFYFCSVFLGKTRLTVAP